MSQFTHVEKRPHNKISKVSIRPYFDPEVPNMGLETLGMVVFDNIMQEEELVCIEMNGIKRWITGLNEFAPEVKNLPEEEQAAKIKDIRRTVAELEKALAANVIKDPETNPDFWNQVKLLRPDNDTLWSKLKIRVGNTPVFMEPDKDPYDLIKLYAIEAGGFSIVAPSLDALRKMQTPTKFYLDKEADTASLQTEVKKLRNKAGKELDIMFSKNITKLMYVLKVADIDSAQYRKTTPNDILYDKADKYINGELFEKNKRKTAELFINLAALDMETLKLRAVVKDAMFFRFIATKPDGGIYHMKTSQFLGKSISDVVEYIKNPLNQDVQTDLIMEVEKYWT